MLPRSSGITRKSLLCLGWCSNK